MDFDADQWEDIINSVELSSNEATTTNSSFNDEFADQRGIVKLTKDNYQTESFGKTQTCIYMGQTLGRAMNIINPPANYQRIRYENECRNTIRYISVPDNRNLTIKVIQIGINLNKKSTISI